MNDFGKEILKNVIDLHIHTNPDVRQRRLDDIELAQEAARVGARAIVIKSHVVPTMDRAQIAEKVVPGIKVFGGITLNPEVGGINPSAVEAARKMGAKIVWLPTAWSAHERKIMGKNDGVESIVNGEIVPPLEKVLEIIAKHDLILGTGHLSPEEIFIVVDKAKKIGVNKIVINHPEWWSIAMPIEMQKKLVPYGVYFERCYATRCPGKDYEKNFAKNLAAIQAVGYESTIIATDGGQLENPMWSDALSEYIGFLLNAGVSQTMIDTMTKRSPAKLLGLSL
ncbi:DUF6282 family protein [Anaerosinus massiliensis]|uniref:DUF6282 family protein n=1 Tax=Massilibacillus massiliensis TaxID=1806837 RepID=UPI000AFC785D|nr:DUF6282 family protein [Massilibacillus massiliensis]